jgi:hypothetical protein
LPFSIKSAWLDLTLAPTSQFIFAAAPCVVEAVKANSQNICDFVSIRMDLEPDLNDGKNIHGSKYLLYFNAIKNKKL